MRQEIFNHDPVYKHFVTAAENLNKACDKAKIESGLEPIEEINKEVENRWAVVNQVVEEKQQKLETTKRQLQTYKEKEQKMDDLLEGTEAVMDQQFETGLDLEQAKANRDTLEVGTVFIKEKQTKIFIS